MKIKNSWFFAMAIFFWILFIIGYIEMKYPTIIFSFIPTIIFTALSIQEEK